MAYLPLLAASHRLALDNVTFRPTLRVLIECYGMMTAPLAAPFMLALVIVIASRSAGDALQASRPMAQGFEFHEIVAALTLAFIPVAALLIALGGLQYTLGAAAYAFEKPRLWPRVFGYHELFHVAVITASLTFYVIVVHYAVPFHRAG